MSILRSECFAECCRFVKLTSLKLKYDAATRWNSVYTMLTRAVYLRKAVDHFVSDIDDKLIPHHHLPPAAKLLCAPRVLP